MKPIPFAKPSFSEAELDAVREVLTSGWVTQGPRVAHFEEQFAAHLGASHACAVSNCTAGLHLALLGVGVAPGDVVLTVSMSFIATANAIRACNAEPVFVDVDPQTLNMSLDALEQTLANDFAERDGQYWYRYVDRLAQEPNPLAFIKRPLGRLAAILIVHQVGMPADLSSVSALAERFQVPLVEDAACAIGSEVTPDGNTWDKIGRPHSRAAVFSFHPRKVLTTGDGGMITTNDPELDRRFRLLRQHGMNLSDLARHSSREVVIESYEETGFNYRMTDLQAAVGAAQLTKLPEIVEQRRQMARWYAEELADIEEVTLPHEPSYARSNWQSYQVTLTEACWKRPVMQGLITRAVSVRRGVMCAHLEAPYSRLWNALPLPNSLYCTNRGVILPLFPQMTHEEVYTVAEALRESLAECIQRSSVSCR